MKKLVPTLVVVLALVTIATWLLFRNSPSPLPATSGNSFAAPTATVAVVDTNAPTLAAWVRNIQTAPALTSAQLNEGIRLAEARRTEMLQLIRENPQRALEQSLKWNEWAALPPEIRALVEQPFSETVEFSMVPDCRPNDSRTTPWQTHRIKMNGEWLDAFVYGRREHASSKNGLLAQGIQLGNQVALWETATLPLEGPELAAAQNLLPDGNDRARSWVTGELIQEAPIAALVGGKIHYFENAEEMHEVAAAIAAAEARSGPHNVVRAMVAAIGDNGTFNLEKFEGEVVTANSEWTEGPKRVLLLYVNFTPPSVNNYTTNMFVAEFLSTSNTFREMSYTKSDVRITLVPQTITITNAQSYWETNSSGADGIMDTAKAIAASLGYATTNFDIFSVAMPRMERYSYAAGFARIGSSDMWLNGGPFGGNGGDVVCHELGHNYGLPHANFWRADTGAGQLGHVNGVGQTVEHDEYGDPFDNMNDSYNIYPYGHFSMQAKSFLNWIEANEVVNVSTSGVYRVRRFDHINARQLASPKLALVVTNSSGDQYWIGYRRAPTNVIHSAVHTGAYIMWGKAQGVFRVIDTSPLSQASLNGSYGQERYDSPLQVGKSWANPDGSVRITTLGVGGTSPNEYLDVAVDLDVVPPSYRLFTSQAATTVGLVGSYVSSSLRSRPLVEDWRVTAGVTISGTRIDRAINFSTESWGYRSQVGVTGGIDANWDNFSVQWDGWLQVDRATKFATRSDDGSRMWIDLNGNGNFDSAPELIDNGWGTGHGTTLGESSVTVSPGLYRIRIQYEEGNGDSVCELVASPVTFDLFTDAALSTNGLIGSYVNANLRGYAPQDDWRSTQTISGTRRDVYPLFMDMGSWGNRTNVGITGGTADDWDNYSVQWDGWIRVFVPTRLATVSDDSSRMWVDVNGNGSFASTAPEFINNHWGTGQGDTYGDASALINPGTYRIRIQYEEALGGNNFGLFGDRKEALGPSGYALQFDGTNSYVEVPNVGLSMPTNEITIEFWQRVYEVRNQLTFSMSPDFPTNRISAHIPWGDSAVYWDFGNYLGAGRLAYVPTNSLVGTWNHFALVSSRSGPYQRIYRNGVLEAIDNTSMTFLRYAAAFRMGGYYAGQFFKGELENFRIWSVARTQAEIQQFMYSSNVGASPNLWADWRFDDGGGTTVTDYSGNGRHGTIVNGAQWVASSVPQLSTAPKIEVFTGATTDPASKRANDGIYTFPGTLIGNSSVTQTFTIKNTGYANLGLALIKTGVNTNDFNVSALGTTILTADLTTTFTVSFTPSTNGFRTATINITSTDENNDPFSIILGGVGLQTLPIVDASAPGDVTQASSPNFPAAEDSAKAIDNNVASKYLNFDELNTGLTITPSGQQPVRALTLISADDAPERDPSSFVLEGSNDGMTFTRIASNAVPAFPARHSIRSFAVPNTNAFNQYRVLFPTVSNSATANSMQIAEVELLYRPELTSTNDTRSITLPPGASDVQGFASLFDRQLDGPRKLEVAPITGGSTIINLTLAAGAKVLKGFELIGAADDFSFPGRRPSSVTFAGSLDGTNYVNLANVTPAAPTSNLQIQEFDTTSNVTAYPRYRIVFGPPVSGDRLQVGEMRLFGENAPVVVIPPMLAIQSSGNNVSISWTNELGFVLESKTSLSAGIWNLVGTAPVLSNGVNTVTLPAAEDSLFFRLRK